MDEFQRLACRRLADTDVAARASFGNSTNGTAA